MKTGIFKAAYSSTSCMALLAILLSGTGQSGQESPSKNLNQSSGETIVESEYRIVRFDARLDALLDVKAEIEVLVEGFTWAEGPVWVPDSLAVSSGYLLFSDVPENRIYKWSDEEGLSVWLEPSGYSGIEERTAGVGSNGLTLDREGKLILAQHGNRQVAKLSAPLADPEPIFETLIDRWEGKRFNSPNDLALDSEGNLYFTDPPYGLDGGEKDPDREIPFSGVYRLNIDGTLDLLDKETRLPNGITLSPNERQLYVTNSDSDNKLLVAYDLAENGAVFNRRILVDMTEMGDGSPDGLKVDQGGNIWTSAPGGVRIFAPDGTQLGAIEIGPCANVGWGDDGATLYMTADDRLMRVRTRLTPRWN